MQIEQLAIKNLETQVEIYKEIIEQYNRMISGVSEKAASHYYLVKDNNNERMFSVNEISSLSHLLGSLSSAYKSKFGAFMDEWNRINELHDRLKKLQP